MLARNAFGDFRQLIEDVTLHPMMGMYLSMLGNQKPNAASSTSAPTRTTRASSCSSSRSAWSSSTRTARRSATRHNQPIPTYDQAVIEGFAHVFTGWQWACAVGSPGNCGFSNTRATVPNQILPMQAFAEEHDTGAKRLLTYPGAAKSVDPGGPDRPQQDLADALDNIFHHPNVGPFISPPADPAARDEQSFACVRRSA